MKKFFILLPIFLLMFSCTTLAAEKTYSKVGVVIIGGTEFKTEDYYRRVEKIFSAPKGPFCRVGKDMQTKYQKFLLNNDIIGETTIRRQNLVGFVKESGCQKILFLVVEENIDSQNNSGGRQKNRITVQVDGYLCNDMSVLEVTTSSQDFKSKTSNLRARRGAFEKCLEEIAPTINPLIGVPLRED